MSKRASSTHLSAKIDPSCERCLSNQELISSLQSALSEVADQNAVLRERTVELEACISEAEDVLLYKKTVLKALEAVQSKNSVS